MMAEAYVGKDRATLIGNPNGTVDVITTVRGEFHTFWHVAQTEVAAILRACRFTLRYATWPEPRPIHDSR
jgi:hypothetical protein